jgi:hypothetical protein
MRIGRRTVKVTWWGDPLQLPLFWRHEYQNGGVVQKGARILGFYVELDYYNLGKILSQA